MYKNFTSKFIFSFILLLSVLIVPAQTFNNTTGGAIPDYNTATSTPSYVSFPITVSGVGIINETLGLKSVCMNITHPYQLDLRVSLKAPDGTILPLCVENNNADDGPNFTNTCFNMAATVPISQPSSAVAPFTGNFLPAFPLGWFNNNINANGIWNLVVEDFLPGDVGTLLNWSITFGSTPAPYPAPNCNLKSTGSNFCETATPICDTSVYCGTTSLAYSPNTWPGLNAASCDDITNNQFYRFVATSTTAIFKIKTINSLNGFGIDVSAFSGNCGSNSIIPSPCVSNITTSTTNNTSFPGLTPGLVYFLMIDGQNGDVCDYQISMVSGVNTLTITPQNPTICLGENTNLNITGGNGTYMWSPALGLNTTSGSTVVASPTTNSTYTVTTGAFAGGLNCPLTASINVVIKPKPIVSSPNNICIGNNGNLTPNTGGTWVSSNSVVATVTNAGVIFANSAGAVTFTFTSSVPGTCTSSTNIVNVTSATTIPTFTAVAPICSGGVLTPLPTTSNDGVTGTWLPALNNLSTTTYTFTPTAGQCATTATLEITVNPILTPTINCGASTTTTVAFNWTAIAGATGYSVSYTINGGASTVIGNIGNLLTYNVTGLNSGDVVVITVLPTGTGCFASSTRSCVANTCATPTATISYTTPVCNNITASQMVNLTGTGLFTGGTYSSMPVGLSLNATTGTITPNTSTPNSYTVTYTITGTVGCPNVIVTTGFVVNPIVTPTFTAVAPICSGGALTPLPTTSNNGITGVWTPALNNLSTTTYTFTPTAGQCATTATLEITVNPIVTPTFTAVAPICSGGVLTPLPTTSNDGVTGTWLPALNNLSTTTYTFTPTAGQCATTATLEITVNPILTPTFTAVAPICSGGVLTPLPTTSNNGVTGTWLPALNNLTTTTYTFTPTAGQCATTATLEITVNPILTPTINCGASTTTTVAFNWTAIAGATGYSVSYTINGGASTVIGNIGNLLTYNVTGLNSGDVVVITVLPTGTGCFASSTRSCVANTCATPTATISYTTPVCNNITASQMVNLTGTGLFTGGTYSSMPVGLSLNATTGTITPNTSTPNSYTVTYTITGTVGCPNVIVTTGFVVNPIVTPTFTAVAPICSGGALTPLPTTSNNGITGVWTPALNNLTTTTYTFTPTAGQCATTATLEITVNPILTPTFTAVAPICSGGVLTPLPTTSNNGVTGTWLPALNNLTTTTYTFTPTAGQCATTATLEITVNPILTPTINCGASTTTTVAFNWTAIAGATGYSVSYTINGGASTVIGNIGNLLTYNVTGLNSGDVVVITVLPTGTGCFASSTRSCVANTCATPTATISYTTPVCNNITASQMVNLTGTGLFTGGTYSSMPVGLSLNATTGTITPNTSTPNSYTVTYTITGTVGCPNVIVTTGFVVNPIVTPTFTAVAPICSGGALTPLPTTSNNGITGVWTPALNNLSTTTYTFTPTAGQCATTATLEITVNPIVTPTFTAVAPICSGGVLTPLPTTSNDGVTGTWLPALNNLSTTTYTFTPTAGQCATTATLEITVNPILTPTINCGASTTTTVAFNWTAIAGATGYSVSYTINGGASTVIGNIGNLLTYNVTGLNSGDVVVITVLPTGTGCFASSTRSCVANTCATPTATISYTTPVCNNITASQMVNLTGTGLFTGGTYSSMPVGLSLNATTGTITPNTSTPNSYTVTYTITGTVGCPNVIVTTGFVVNPIVTPTFTAVAPICSGGALTPLPTTSNNGITGVWTPALNNLSTTTYTFTPTAGQCATTATLEITVNPIVTPTFTAVAPICSGGVLTPLPTTSNDGVTGTWLPALNNLSTTTYTFTPTAGQCATTATLEITVNPILTPTFTAVAPICSGGVLTPLPTTSNNGVTGTWLPALNNLTTTTYTFTPTAGQCATTATLVIAVNPIVTPIFTAIAPLCSGAVAPILPTTSNNGIVGTWNPSIVNNLVTGTYTFTPSIGQGCASNVTITINVDNNNSIIPNFNPLLPICNGATPPTLLTTSLNGITGTWNQLVPSNTSTDTYTFTPTTGQCASTTTLTLTVIPNIVPSFNFSTLLCIGATAPVLPTTSTEGIVGTWVPNVVSNLASATYTFTPTAGQCALVANIQVTVKPSDQPTFTFNSNTICAGTIAPTLSSISNNGYTGVWSPAVVSNQTSGNYTFTPDPVLGQCLLTYVLPIVVTPKPFVYLGNDTTMCEGDTKLLDVSHPDPSTTYLWQNGTTTPQFVIDRPGTYSVKLTLNNCVNFDTKIVKYDLKPKFSLGQNQKLCVGNSIILDPQYLGTEPVTYLWKSGSTSSVDTIKQIGIYYLDMTNSCGTTRDSVEITTGFCNVFAPNTFSPNGDGLNDIFKIISNLNLTEFKLIIFNRYGQKVFESKNNNQGWDGRQNGKMVEQGVYNYYYQYKNPTNNTLVTNKGTIVVVR